MEKIKLEIGDKLYAISPTSLFTYEVYEIRRQAEGKVLYAVVCEACRDHEPCKVLIEHFQKNEFLFVSMLNNYNGEDEDGGSCYEKNHEWYHRKNHFFTDKNSSLIFLKKTLLEDNKEGLKRINERYKNEKKGFEERIASLENEIAVMEEQLVKEKKC
ncbi:MAG: hypothetical protein LBQ52_04940 [Helicobacteraceae bacterium]|jgi:FtsZ-binding cell division protein ZapB|nr:hypothetical protein [Helicobacteraceae bacterium]